LRTDRFFKGILWGGGVFFGLLLVFIFIFLLKGSWLSIKAFGLKFLVMKVWDPIQERFGLLPLLVGTLLTSLISLIISLPFSFSIALLLSFYVKTGFLNKTISYTTDLLAGIPSVIYGLWALFFLVPFVRWLEIKLHVIPYGVGILTASLVLSVMIIPYASSMMREVMKLVPKDLIEAGYSMGATRYDVVRKVIIPYARSGIIAGLLLSFGRAFGETMAVTMVIGNANTMPQSIFSPSNTMASIIANEFTEAVKEIHLSSLIHVGLWLFIITFIINLMGNYVIKRFEVR